MSYPGVEVGHLWFEIDEGLRHHHQGKEWDRCAQRLPQPAYHLFCREPMCHRLTVLKSFDHICSAIVAEHDNRPREGREGFDVRGRRARVLFHALSAESFAEIIRPYDTSAHARQPVWSGVSKIVSKIHPYFQSYNWLEPPDKRDGPDAKPHVTAPRRTRRTLQNDPHDL